VKEIISLNKVRLMIESPFKYLPYAQSVLINAVIPLANPETGVVENITYRDLSELLTVKSAPGRKDSGTPTKQTIRNYLNSIEKQCGDAFKVVTENQQLRIIFPYMPAIYAEFLGLQPEANTLCDTELNTPTPLINTDEYDDFEMDVKRDLNTGVNTELNTAEDAVKNIFIKNITKTKLTNTTGVKAIADDFYPNNKTITLAISQGLIKVTDPIEINKFITHNQKHQTTWEDYNSVFITWLERDRDYYAKKAKQSLTEQKTSAFSRSNSHDKHTTTKRTGYDLVQEAILLNQRIIDDCRAQEGGNTFQAMQSEQGAYCTTVDSINSHLWSIVS
jgi:hypothetical protein